MTKRTTARCALILAAALIASVCVASPALAVTQTTTYYTLGVTGPFPSSTALFVAVQSPDAAPVVLASHDPAQLRHQWTTVWPDYPAGPTTRACGFSIPFVFCPPGAVAYKLVNRYSGKCLTAARGFVSGTHGPPATQQRCSSAPSVTSSQTWGLKPGADFRTGPWVRIRDPKAQAPLWLLRAEYARPDRRQFVCLDLTGARHQVGAPLQAWACHQPRTWSQSFVVRPFAQVICNVPPYRPCGAPPPR
jgi:hypothetical protein